MKRLAMLFAMLATVHSTEALVTPQRVVAAKVVVARVAVIVRLILEGWKRMPVALTQRQA